MMNIGSFRQYLDVDTEDDANGVPKGIIGTHKDIAKTLLKKTLAEHDAVYHKNGYKEGDECNFRASLTKGDDSDKLIVPEKKSAKEKLGLVKYKIDANGKKEIIGIEDISKINNKKNEEKEVMDNNNLKKHDAQYHNGHYDGKAECKYREDFAKHDDGDNLTSSIGETHADRMKAFTKAVSSALGDDYVAIAEHQARPGRIDVAIATYEPDQGEDVKGKYVDTISKALKDNGIQASLMPFPVQGKLVYVAAVRNGDEVIKTR